MQIIPARATDEAEVRLLLRSSDLPTEDLSASLLQHFLVLREGPVLIGVVGLEPVGNTALLRSLAVAPSGRGRGIGRRLVAAAETLAQKSGVRTLHLLTTTADRFFAGLGYRAIARADTPAVIQSTSQFATLCPSTAVVMTKAL